MIYLRHDVFDRIREDRRCKIISKVVGIDEDGNVRSARTKRGWHFRPGRSNGGRWCRRADDRKWRTRRKSDSSRGRRRTMFWSTSRSSTSRTGRSLSWRRFPGNSCSSGDGCCTDPSWTSWTCWCTNSCTALGPSSPRFPDSRGPRSGEASTDSGLDQGQRHGGEQARLWKTARRLRRRVPARALHPARDLLSYHAIKLPRDAK